MYSSSDKQWLCQSCETPKMADPSSRTTAPPSPKDQTDWSLMPDLPQRTKSSTIHCYLLNARSIMNKLCDLQALLSMYDIDILEITETHLSGDIRIRLRN